MSRSESADLDLVANAQHLNYLDNGVGVLGPQGSSSLKFILGQQGVLSALAASGATAGPQVRLR